MSQPSIFDSEIALPSDVLAGREKRLLGFDARYTRVHDQLRLLLNVAHQDGGVMVGVLLDAPDEYGLCLVHGHRGNAFEFLLLLPV